MVQCVTRSKHQPNLVCAFCVATSLTKNPYKVVAMTTGQHYGTVKCDYAGMWTTQLAQGSCSHALNFIEWLVTTLSDFNMCTPIRKA